MEKKLIALFLLTLIFSCSKKTEKIQPSVENITESVYASGVVKSKNQYQVFSTVNGLIQEIFVAEGGLVKKGDPILRILNESSKLNAENARLAADYADFNAKGEKLSELKANIDLAKNKLNSDSLLYARQKSLWAQQLGTLNELEQRELSYKNSQTAYRNAVSRYNDTKKQLDFAAKQSKKNLQITTSFQNDFIVRSEADGRVYSLLKEKGEMANTLTPIAVIGDDKSFVVELQIDEYDITKIKVGQKVLFALDSYKGQVFEGKVDKILAIMNERTKTFTVEASFVAKPETLYANLTTEANIVIRTIEKALTVPRNYLIDDSYVLKENKEKVKLEIGLKDYQKVQILSGLNPGEFILKPEK
jgi:multidrug efflux pump subunit AcrA (membrane-fusion protein)